MKIQVIMLSGLFAFMVSSCTHPSNPVPQSGPIVGKWAYLGSDLQKPEEGIVRSFVIGDHTWWVPRELEFFDSGRVTSGHNQECYFQVKSDHQMEIDCHQGSVTINYSIQKSTLTLNLDGTQTALSGGGPLVQFRKVR